MKLRVSDDVVFRDLAGEAVILNLDSGMYFGLNEVGTRFWHLVSEQGSTEQAIVTLLTEYDVEEGCLRSDIEALVQQLLDKSLVQEDTGKQSVAG
jgi:hypothetical protein